MEKHIRRIEETSLWQAYIKKVSLSSNRYRWIGRVYSVAVEFLKAVRDTFPNYTLHDETHILNVMVAMDGILGDRIDELSIGELELLILAASLHDIGMVYSKEEKERTICNKKLCNAFLSKNCPEMMGLPYEEWSEENQQYYLRSIHPFRLPQILKQTEWHTVFNERPKEIVPEQYIIAVCQAHGESLHELVNNPNLKYLKARDIDPLFCAMLLRLADLLDFDDTRAPKILFCYAANNPKSIIEWKKHMDSEGFRYPVSPSTDDLLYTAECTTPEVKHAIDAFLDWVDDELGICSNLQKLCEKDWQRNFPFPRAVSRKEITFPEYVNRDFKLTMNQPQILKLLSGEHLYENNVVFLRELLQNAIDATLLREKLDHNFHVEDGRINLWEWNADDGYIWFRIDDQGTGMTLGMIERYFLKVGNSYYTSKELIRDLHEYGSQEGFQGISRFGIGFLSCFLCGNYAEISTLYFDERKNRQESHIPYHEGTSFCLRMQITGLSGYYTLKSEAENHEGWLPLPTHPSTVDDNAYRTEPGTSIVIRLDPGALGLLDLKDVAKRFVCGTRMPIYFNGERIGCTYPEFISKLHGLPPKTIFDLLPKDKKKFDDVFSEIQGQYPTIITKPTLLDAEKYQVLPGISGVIIDYEAHFNTCPQWQVKDQIYRISANIQNNPRDGNMVLKLYVKNATRHLFRSWEALEYQYNIDDLIALKKKLLTLQVCPPVPESLGSVWLPFARHEDVRELWVLCLDSEQERELEIPLEMYCPITLNKLLDNPSCHGAICAYHGLLVGDFSAVENKQYHFTDVLFFLENRWQPTMDVSRSRILDMPLEVCMEISGLLFHPDIGVALRGFHRGAEEILLPEWRKIRESPVGDWLWNIYEDHVERIKQTLSSLPVISKNRAEHINLSLSIFGDNYLYKYLIAYFQDTYNMTINYENNQIITFVKKEVFQRDIAYDFFPPMMFCKAANDQSRQYLCSADRDLRRGITSDHPFIEWLLQNVTKIDLRFKRQIQQIIFSLHVDRVNDIIQKVNIFREQLISMHNFRDTALAVFNPLTPDDFWYIQR